VKHVPMIALLLVVSLLAVGCGGGGDPDPTPTGVVKVDVEPFFVDAGWTLTGPGSATLTGTGDMRFGGRAVGSWTIVWDEYAGRIRPLSQTRTLADGDSITFQGVYTEPPTTGTLTIDVEPADLPIRWVLKRQPGSGQDDRTGTGDAVLTDLPPGPFTVAWQRVPGWTLPAPGWIDGLITAGETTAAAVTYTVLPAWPLEFVRLEAGAFTMGSPANEPGRETDEGPRHEVTLTRPILVAVTELTNGQWEGVVRDGRLVDPTLANQPVSSVTWHEAVGFCNAMSAADGLTAAYSVNGPQVAWNPASDGWRLPTEAEWEALCRAGSTGSLSDGALSRLDFDPDPVLTFFGWSAADSDNHVKPVRALLPNPLGLYDVHGNVLEWCWDRYSDATYTGAPATDPSGPETGSTRVLRGGSFADSNQRLRCAARAYLDPDSAVGIVGFRLVRNAPPIGAGDE
jgi:formylglycine-generating enzyme required for sulfatase activity